MRVSDMPYPASDEETEALERWAAWYGDLN
jgi:hypothetical protein